MHEEPSPPPLRRFQDPTLCVHCHHQNQQGARYCEHCGMPLPVKAAAPRPGREDRPDATGSRWFALGKLFSAHGHVGRKDYWIVYIGSGVLFLILLVGAAFVLDALGLDDADDRAARNSRFHGTSTATGGLGTLHWLVFGGIFALCALVVLLTTIKRYHDMGTTGWWLLVAWVPGINLISLLLCAFRRGNPGINTYGAVNSGTPFPVLHPRDSHGSLP